VAGTHRELKEYQKYLKQVCHAIHQIEPGKSCHSRVIAAFTNPDRRPKARGTALE
jgi:hypothetical protein